MALYKVEYKGVAFVEADDKEEAIDMYEDMFSYEEKAVTNVVKVKEITLHNLKECED